jgi:transcriptional regulator with XRE-family HTH domain
MVGVAAPEIGIRVRRLRAELGWTQGQLAVQASHKGPQEISRGWLSQVESGDIDKPEAGRLNQLALALGTTVDYLMNGPAPDGSVTLTVPENVAPRLNRLKDVPGDVLDALEHLVARTHLRQPDADEHAERERE